MTPYLLNEVLQWIVIGVAVLSLTGIEGRIAAREDIHAEIRRRLFDDGK